MTHFLRTILRFVGVIGAVALVTAIDVRLVRANSPTAAFSFLLLVLALATTLGLKESIVASIVSVFAYNFFFLPPIGTLTIADPQNWVAALAFLITAVTASQLSSSARKRAEEAAARAQEVERMYDFSRALMLRQDERSLLDHFAQSVSTLFAAEEVAIYDRESDSIRRAGRSDQTLTESSLRAVTEPGQISNDSQRNSLIVSIHLGGRCFGSLGIAGTHGISDVALQAIAQLIAIALERQKAQEAAARAEATRQNEQLKSTLLDALAHEFKTPLTSIKAAATTALSRPNLDEMQQDLLSVVDEETDHLNYLVTEAIELARIGAGPVKLHKEVWSAEDLIASVVTRLKGLQEARGLTIEIDSDLPPVEVDRPLIELALRQLLSNAYKYSPGSSTIEISAQADNESVTIFVANTGPGIPKAEQNLVFEKFYRGRDVRARIPGTGMGLAIAKDIVEAHGGRMWLAAVSETSVRFALSLPAHAPATGIDVHQGRTVA